MNPSISSSNHLYDAYYIENIPTQPFIIPDNCDGAIGITIDDKIQGLAHTGLKFFNIISTNLQDIQPYDPNFGVNLKNVMHAFVVTSHSKSNTLDVCEAVGSGFTNAEIKMGDNDWTSMVLFIPKDSKIRNQVLINARNELKEDKEKGIADYAFTAGILSVFSKKEVFSSQKNKEIIVEEMANLIKSHSIRDNTGNPKAAICSQLAMRVLRSSILISAIPSEKIRKYEQLDDKKLQEKLLVNITKSSSPLTQIFWSSKIFQVEAGNEALPYELYKTLIEESDIHKSAKKDPINSKDDND